MAIAAIYNKNHSIITYRVDTLITSFVETPPQTLSSEPGAQERHGERFHAEHGNEGRTQ